MIVVYSPNGQINYTVEYPWPQGTPEFYDEQGIVYTIVNKEDIIDKYIVDNDMVPRPRMDLTMTNTNAAVGDTVYISGIPSGAEVIIGTQTYTADGTDLELTSSSPTTIQVQVTQWPYLEEIITVGFSNED